jgi:DNA endonuclease I-like protein
MGSVSFLDPTTSCMLVSGASHIYVYIDWTLEALPRPFYVGQGDRSRVMALKRNQLHADIVTQHGIRREIVTVTDVVGANLEERRLIAELKTRHNVKGHWGANKAGGGRGTHGYRFTAEQRQHVRDSRPNKVPIVQYTMEGGVIAVHESQSRASTTTRVPQTNISKCCLRQLQSAGGFIWRREGDTFEPKQRSTWKFGGHRPLVQLALTDDVPLARYGSIMAAAIASNVHFSGISRCLQGRQKTAGGYRWRHAT